MGFTIKQGQTRRPLLFRMTLSSDHVSPAAGKTPTVKIGKNGAAGVTPAGAVTEVDATNLPGWYAVAGNATDSNTLGPLTLVATATLCDQTDEMYEVVAYDPDTVNSFGLAAAGLDSVLVESGLAVGPSLTDDTGTQLAAINARQALALNLAALAGVLAGATSTEITIKGGGKPTGNTRIDAIVDANGNRTAFTLKVPT